MQIFSLQDIISLFLLFYMRAPQFISWYRAGMIKSLCDQILCYYRIPLPPTWSSTLLVYCLQHPMPMKISTDLHAHQTVIVILICFSITITSAFQNQYNDCLRHQLWGWSFVTV